jgi:hypothetical protein
MSTGDTPGEFKSSRTLVREEMSCIGGRTG